MQAVLLRFRRHGQEPQPSPSSLVRSTGSNSRKKKENTVEAPDGSLIWDESADAFNIDKIKLKTVAFPSFICPFVCSSLSPPLPHLMRSHGS
jgi:hypothetical protein